MICALHSFCLNDTFGKLFSRKIRDLARKRSYKKIFHPTPPVFTPPVFTPPLFTPPLLTPPLFTPPLFTPPLLTPPLFTPPLLTPPLLTPPLFTPPLLTPPLFTPPLFLSLLDYYLKRSYYFHSGQQQTESTNEKDDHTLEVSHTCSNINDQVDQ